MSKEFVIKKNIFGGFDRRQVIDYIAHLQSQCANSETKAEIETSKEKIKVFLAEIEEKNQKIQSLTDELNTLNSFAASAQNKDSLETIAQADKILEKAKNEAEKYISTSTAKANEHTEKFSRMMSKLTSLNEEIALIGANAGKISSEIADIEIEEAEVVSEGNQSLCEDDHMLSEASEIISEEEPSEIEIKQEDDCFAPSVIQADTDVNVDEDSFNYIDNFFTELEKLTGIPDFYDNVQDINEVFDRNRHILPEDKAESVNDEAFDGLIKNVFNK